MYPYVKESLLIKLESRKYFETLNKKCPWQHPTEESFRWPVAAKRSRCNHRGTLSILSKGSLLLDSETWTIKYWGQTHIRGFAWPWSESCTCQLLFFTVLVSFNTSEVKLSYSLGEHRWVNSIMKVKMVLVELLLAL